MAGTEVSDVIIEKCSSFEKSFTLLNDDGTPTSLTGVGTANATIRKYSSSSISENFSLSVSGADGIITLSLTPEETSNLESGRNYFDVLMYTTVGGSVRKKYLKGTALVEETMTV